MHDLGNWLPRQDRIGHFGLPSNDLFGEDEYIFDITRGDEDDAVTVGEDVIALLHSHACERHRLTHCDLHDSAPSAHRNNSPAEDWEAMLFAFGNVTARAVDDDTLDSLPRCRERQDAPETGNVDTALVGYHENIARAGRLDGGGADVLRGLVGLTRSRSHRSGTSCHPFPNGPQRPDPGRRAGQ